MLLSNQVILGITTSLFLRGAVIMNSLDNGHNDYDNTQVINLIILDKEISIRVFFSGNCLLALFDNIGIGDTYKRAFEKIIYQMFKNTNYVNERILSEEEFFSIANNDLLLILKMILNENVEIEKIYNETYIEDQFERFYKALEAYFFSSTQSIPKALEHLSQELSCLSQSINSQILESFGSFDNAIGQKLVEFEPTFLGLDNKLFEEVQSSAYDAINASFPGMIAACSAFSEAMIGIQGISIPLENIAERFGQINEGIIDSIQPQLAYISEQAKSIFTAIDYSVVFGKRWDDYNHQLYQYNWWYISELPENLIEGLFFEKETVSQEEVDEAVIAYFRNDRCKELKRIVSGWVKLPNFYNRKLVFHEALVNHSRKYFNTSITMLVLHTEGVIIDFLRQNLNKKRYRASVAINELKNELQNRDGLLICEWIIYNNIIERIELVLTGNFDCSNPDNSSNTLRHKIAHGHVHEKETEINSLTMFLYLNELYKLFLFLTNQ